MWSSFLLMKSDSLFKKEKKRKEEKKKQREKYIEIVEGFTIHTVGTPPFPSCSIELSLDA
jgi:hypothetical protein